MSEVKREFLTLKRLDICDCGYGVLDDSIGVGTVYEVEPNSVKDGFFYKCGQCGREQHNVRVIYAKGQLSPCWQMLPYDLFVEAQ